MKTKLKITSALLITSAVMSLTGCKAQDDVKMNVLLIAVDDLRPALACYDDPLAISPNIDRLAKEGALFQNHYVQAPSCAPSRTSMLTGYRPDEVEVTDHKTHFRETRPEVVTLPELFKKNGYTTVSLGKIFHYAKGYNDSQSWNEEHFLQGEVSGYYLKENREVRGKAHSSECAEVPDNAYADGQIAEKAIEYLEEFQGNKTPFFLGVGFLKPHLPFNAPKRYWDMHDRERFGEIPGRNRPEHAPSIAFHNWQELRGYIDIPEEGKLTTEKEKELRHAYYACVSYVDAQIGMVLQKLDDLGLRENTIVFLWGDHGYHLGEENLWCKSTNFERSARSPLIISAPGMKQKGSAVDAMVESVDIYPTIIDLCGLVPPDHLAGTSLVPLVKDPEKEWYEMAFNQFARPYKAAISGKEPKTHMGYSVRIEGWRYTSWYNVNTDSFEFPELYRLSGDHQISDNLAGQSEYSDVERRLLNAVMDYRNGKIIKE